MQVNLANSNQFEDFSTLSINSFWHTNETAYPKTAYNEIKSIPYNLAKTEVEILFDSHFKFKAKLELSFDGIWTNRMYYPFYEYPVPFSVNSWSRSETFVIFAKILQGSPLRRDRRQKYYFKFKAKLEFSFDGTLTNRLDYPFYEYPAPFSVNS